MKLTAEEGQKFLTVLNELQQNVDQAVLDLKDNPRAQHLINNLMHESIGIALVITRLRIHAGLIRTLSSKPGSLDMYSPLITKSGMNATFVNGDLFSVTVRLDNGKGLIDHPVLTYKPDGTSDFIDPKHWLVNRPFTARELEDIKYLQENDPGVYEA